MKARKLPLLGLVALLGLAGGASALGCGASVSSIYEGDVRFEHCMALDARPAVTGPQRRQCWIEWVRYYTYGQTQDRVEYAVAHASGSVRPEKESESTPIVAAPEPTSAFAPPPMMIESEADAGAPPPTPPPAETGSATKPGTKPPQPKGTAPPAEPARPIDPGCQADCAEARADCRTSCQGGSCEKSCSGKYTRCLERCAEVRGR